MYKYSVKTSGVTIIMKNTVLKCENLIKTYGSGDKTFNALDGVTMHVDEGELLVILGASGSGKSTLLNILSGMDKCTSGTVVYNGALVSSMNEKALTKYRKNEVGYIFQSFNLINELTVFENVMLVADDKLAAKDCIEKTGLKDLADKYPKNLSGGEQQRVAIARALTKKCGVMFCDEPTGSLDSVTGKQIMILLEGLSRKDHKTVVVVTHNNEIAKIADRVYTMKNGKITDEKINDAVIRAEDLEW